MAHLLPSLIPPETAQVSPPQVDLTDPSSLYDIAVGGIGFVFANTVEKPMVRETVPLEKQRVDQAATPGEQTLTSWWMKSQESFHGGAGQLQLEPAAQTPLDHVRFDLSKNLDVSVPGRVSRLPDTTTIDTATADRLVSVTLAGVDAVAYLTLSTGTVSLVTNVLGTPTTVAFTGVSGVKEIATDGTSVYAATTTDIWRLNPAAVGTPVKLSTYPAAATTGPVLGWVKSRLMLGVNGGVYETDVSQTAVTLGATQLRYQHPVAGWTWRCFGVSPSAILAAGDAGGQSAITQFNLNMVAGAPVLQVAGDIAPLPVGERVLSLLSSQGSFLAIGTTRGVRIGTFNTYTGALVYGPLHLGPLDPIIPAVGLAQRDRFIYAVGKSYDEAGLIRVDLGVQTDQSGRYAWTPDLIGPTAPTANPDIAQVGVSRVTEQGTAGTTSFVVNMPATVNAGELLFAAIGSGGGVTATPAGWTLAGGANQATADAIYGFYKTATGAEAGTTVTFTIGAAGRATGVVNRYSSVNGTPIDVTPATGQNTGVGSTVTVPQVVTVTDRTYGVTMAAVNAAVGISWTAPTGFTLVAASSGTGKGTAYASGYVQTPAGNTGTQTWQCSTVNLQMNALTVFLRPTAAPASTATSMTVLPQSGRIVFAIPGTGVLLEGVGPGSLREAWLRTSRIRYSTVEPKLFKLGRVRGDFLSGEIRVTAITPYTNQVVATAGFTASDPDEFRLLDGKAEWMQLMFDVIGATTKLTTYQVKALPGTRRQRHLQFVLSLADSVTGKTGQRIRDTLSSRDHLAALEALDAAGDEVVLQEFTPKGVISTRVVIEQVSFAQSLRPTRKSDLGGEITILLRTVES